MPEGVDEGEDVTLAFCDLIEKEIPIDHDFFRYLSSIRNAQAHIGLAISTTDKIQETRDILDMLDTLSSGLYDPDVKLPDLQRKMIKRSEETPVDLVEKMSRGDLRAAHLLSASSMIQLAAGYLTSARKDPDFAGVIPDYTIKYMYKLSIFVYREAMGHVLM
ncbi:MAG: DUF1940 domain-containing protein [Thermoplasmataceae archaeon]